MKEVITSIEFEAAENLYVLTAVNGEKKFRLVMEKDSGLGASYDAIATMAKYVSELIQQHQQSLVPSAPETKLEEKQNE